MTTESRATNPFLVEQLDNSCPMTSTSRPVFNPFEMPREPSAVPAPNSSNPFLQSATSTTDSGVFTRPSNVTNPFAAFFQNEQSTQPVSSDTNLIDVYSASTEPFHNEQKYAEVAPRNDENVPNLLLDDNEAHHAGAPTSALEQTGPTITYRRDSHDSRKSSISSTTSPPRRPPPPRPALPKKTKDLILSVTGALEATSTDLLDRLQATRTPSPTPLKELNFPSPVAPIEVNDLLGDDDIITHTRTDTEVAQNIREDAVNIFSMIDDLPKHVETKAPSPPLLMSSPSLFQQPQLSPIPTSQPPPPPPPSRPPPPQLPIQTGEVNLADLLIEEETANHAAPTKSLADNVGTYTGVSNWTSPQGYNNATGRAANSRASSTSIPSVSPPSSNLAVETGANYVATRKASHDITAGRIRIPQSRKKYSLDYSATGVAPITRQPVDPFDATRERYNETAFGQSTGDSSCRISELDRLSESNSEIKNVEYFDNPPFDTNSVTPTTVYDNKMQETIINYEVPADQFDEVLPDLKSEMNYGTETNLAQDIEKFDLHEPAINFNTKATPAEGQPSSFNDLFAQTNDFAKTTDDFDVFEQKFESFKDDLKRINDGTTSSTGDPFDPFGGASVVDEDGDQLKAEGFGNEGTFDEFLALNHPVAAENDIGENDLQLNEFQSDWDTGPTSLPTYAAAQVQQKPTLFEVQSQFATDVPFANDQSKQPGSDLPETPPTPLFDEDISQPLEPFPRTIYTGPGWEMQIRYPIRKKFTGQRFWKKVFVKLVYQGETPHLELMNKDDGKETLLHEWPLQPCYAISDIGAQQYDQYGKIFTVKIQFVVYKERPGVRPGQVTKAERLTNKLSQFAAYAIQGDYQGVKEFGSDLKKLGLPVEHSPQISLICKLGSHNYEDMKQFSVCVEEALFKLPAHRDNIHINYKMEEVQITAVDELYVEQNLIGSVTKQIARVRLFFLGFLTGMPDVEIGVNDLRRQGKEVVGRHDIIPVVTEEWIRLENVEFHSCIQQDVYEETKTIKFKPPDACYLELMRFRVRPPKNRELPLQLKTVFRICGNKVDILADIMVPGFTSRKLGQIPCEDVAVRIPIPECWIYLFRVEKHFRYGSVKSAHRRTGKIKGIERFLGAVDTLETHLIEVTSGHAKYEHHHRSIVWRMARLPKEGQGAYTSHSLVCHLALTSFDQIPEELAKYCFVEFTMPITQVSHTTVRSVSICNSDSDSPPEKYVRHLARHEYRVEIEHTHAESTNEYVAATRIKPAKLEAQPPPPTKPESIPNSESDSD